jgi:O-antigen biosynthesis protein WbqV
MAEADTNTRFTTVRFGNVIGSSGSVVPLFVEQAMLGGPITVTHPDIVRYFITIAEAVDLVLKASQLGLSGNAEKGAIYTLEMGKPINILELARQVCKAVGKRLGENVELKVVGLRPGEKLIEELAYTSEDVASTSVPGINCALPRKPSGISADWLSLLCEYTGERRPDAVLALLKDLVPEYRLDELAEAA